MALVLTRKERESILIGYDTTLTVREVYQDAVGLVLKVPNGAQVNIVSNDDEEFIKQQCSYLNDQFSQGAGYSILDYVLMQGEYIEVENTEGIKVKVQTKIADGGAGKVRIAIEAPKELPIHREELIREHPDYEEPPEPNVIELETGYTGLYGYGKNNIASCKPL